MLPAVAGAAGAPVATCVIVHVSSTEMGMMPVPEFESPTGTVTVLGQLPGSSSALLGQFTSTVKAPVRRLFPDATSDATCNDPRIGTSRFVVALFRHFGVSVSWASHASLGPSTLATLVRDTPPVDASSETVIGITWGSATAREPEWVHVTVCCSAASGESAAQAHPVGSTLDT